MRRYNPPEKPNYSAGLGKSYLPMFESNDGSWVKYEDVIKLVKQYQDRLIDYGANPKEFLDK